MDKLVYITILLPFVGAVLAFLVGKFTQRWNSFWVAFVVGAITFASSAYIAYYVALNGVIKGSFKWFSFGNYAVSLGVYVDSLAVIMLLIATGIGFLDIVFSKGYMEDDTSPHRYFFEILFFIGSMVGLVLVDNLVGLYMFWEGVGLCSYLLIGYWYWKKSAAEAALKAFVMTRFGDVFMLAGIIVCWYFLGTINFQELNALSDAGAFSVKLGLIGCMLLFMGAIGKSAQFPLFPWLLDAMEGPTTVSALIHAATMVNAGVYMVARMFPFFKYSHALEMVAVVGAISAFIGATGAMAHTEIKKILAFSTMEHLALMFVGIGVGSVGAGIFHLSSHAVFKALLFLSAGAVIHMAHHVKDAFKFGGLYRFMPKTAILFLIGAVSLAGIPPFNGFFSKDWILGEALHGHSLLVFVLAFLSAVLCIAYIFRLWFTVFTGRPSEVSEHTREAYNVMLVPLYVLAALTLITAVFKDNIVHFLVGAEAEEHFNLNLFVGTFTVMAVLFAFSYMIYFKRLWSTGKFLMHPLGSALNKFLFKGWLFDDGIKWICRNIFYGTVARAVEWVDTNVVDGAVNGTARVSLACWDRCRKMQTGDVVNYLMYFVAGAIVVIIFASVGLWWK